MELKFEWDVDKAQVNLAKHGVSFAEAKSVFDDPLARVFRDEEHSFDEARHIIVGYSIAGRLLFVCFVDPSETVIRIFSARPATASERKDHESALQN